MMADTPARSKVTRTGAVNAYLPCTYCPIQAVPVANERGTKDTLYPAGYYDSVELTMFDQLERVVSDSADRTKFGFRV